MATTVVTAKSSSTASSHATSQYALTHSKLAARLAIHKYNTHPLHWFAWVGSRLPKQGDILEIGAGTGELWTHTPTPTSPATLTLSDFSEAMCNQLRAAVPSAKEVVCCSATSLPFPDNSFDGVIANHMLYHVDDPDAALAEFARVLRPGGTVAVALNGMDHLNELLEIGAKVGRPSVIRSRAAVTAENAVEVLSKRFQNVDAQRCPGGFETKDAAPVLRYIESLGDEPLSEVQKQEAARIVTEVIEREGRFGITKNMVLFTGRG